MLPNDFTQNMEELLGVEFEAFKRAMEGPSHSGIRANRLKISPKALKELIGQDLSGVDWCSDGFYLPDGFRAGKSPLYHAGLYYIQEPSAMSAAMALGVNPKERVLDLCAAPGGKSTQLAGALCKDGLLVCNDISRSRLKALVKNLELAGVPNAVVTCEEPGRLALFFEEFFDKILIDAPCSGEGMFRKDKDVLKAYSRQRSRQFADISQEILASAARMLSPGGRLLFSTCTFNKAENEDAVDTFLSLNPDFSPAKISIEGSQGFVSGFGKNGTYFSRIFPHKVRGEGHFIALLEKKKQGLAPTKNTPYIRQASLSKATGSQRDAFREFEANTLRGAYDFGDSDIYAMGDTLYLLPRDTPELGGIRLARAGLRLGEVRGPRFEPSQALAMALARYDVNQALDLPHVSAEVVKYLKGETLEAFGGLKDGWILICTEGYPLGWGKVLGGIIKNRYNKHWLMG